MADVVMYVVCEAGAKQVALEVAPASLHDVPAWLPLGVYTSLRTFEHSKFLHLAEHLQRLQRSMEVLGWRYALNEMALRQALREVCVAYDHADARVRIDVLAQAAAQFACDSRLLLTLAPFEPPAAEVYARGVIVAPAPQLRREQPEAKKADFVRARRQAVTGDAYEILLLDGEGRLLEGSSSNFYGVRDGAVFTAGSGVLEGITRGIVLQLVVEASVPLHRRAVRLEETAQLDEAFLSSSSRGLVPVRRIGENVVGDGRPGPITRRLMAAYERYVARHIRPAVPA